MPPNVWGVRQTWLPRAAATQAGHPPHVGEFTTNDIYDAGVTVWWLGHDGDPPFNEPFEGLFVAGDTVDSTFAFDWGTIHYNP